MTTHITGHAGTLHITTLPSGALCITAENPSTGATCAHIDPADLRDALADKPNLSVSWDERDFDFHIRRWNGQSVPASEVDDEDALQALVTMTDVVRDELIEAGRPVPGWAAKPLTRSDVTDEMVQRAWTAWHKGSPRNMHSMRLALRAALPESEGAEAPDLDQHEARPDVDPLPILDEVARLDRRLADARRMKALWRETAREHIRRGRTHAGYQEMMEANFNMAIDQRDRAIERVDALSDENDKLRDQVGLAIREKDEWEGNAEDAEHRAEKAEQELASMTAERNLNRDRAVEWMNKALRTQRTKQPRPLTEGSTTDAQVDAALRVEASHRAVWDDSDDRGRVRKMLTAALAPESPRPDGAEAIEAMLRDQWTFEDDDDFADLANRLAEQGVRVAEETGLHLVDEHGPWCEDSGRRITDCASYASQDGAEA